jgi:hypothetical protein
MGVGMGRPWLFRVSVAGNLLLLTYVALYSSSTSDYPPRSSNSGQDVSPLSTSSSSSNGLKRNGFNNEADPIQVPQSQQLIGGSNSMLSPNINPNQNSIYASGSSDPNNGGNHNKNSPEDTNNISKGNTVADDDSNKPGLRGGSGSDGNGVVWDGDDTALGEGIAPDLMVPGSQDSPSSRAEMLLSMDNDSKIVDPREFKLFPCDDLTPRSYYGQRGPYWVLYNYIKAAKSLRCDQSITYTTHADFTFLDNLEPLLERWQGPLSLSVYAPGTDFNETLRRILYLRECRPNQLVKDFVTFHLFFDNRHVPRSKIPRDPLSLPINCSASPVPTFGESLMTYKKTKKLSYPVNVARNVAREMATTHYILPSDIELYPNPNLIPDFLEMIRINDSFLQRPNPKVFVLSIFEVEANVTSLPQDKKELLFMLKNKSAIPFHKYVCSNCHRIPKAEEWMTAPIQGGVRVFHVGKRHKPYHHWEPIFIGTKFDPTYDERLSWEGRSDKMTQVSVGITKRKIPIQIHSLNSSMSILFKSRATHYACSTMNSKSWTVLFSSTDQESKETKSFQRKTRWLPNKIA